MVKNEPPSDVGEKPQVNVQLEHEEFDSLKKICDAEGIKRPATLVGIWIRTQLKERSGMNELFAKVVSVTKDDANAREEIEKVIRRIQRRKYSAAEG